MLLREIQELLAMGLVGYSGVRALRSFFRARTINGIEKFSYFAAAFFVATMALDDPDLLFLSIYHVAMAPASGDAAKKPPNPLFGGVYSFSLLPCIIGRAHFGQRFALVLPMLLIISSLQARWCSEGVPPERGEATTLRCNCSEGVAPRRGEATTSLQKKQTEAFPVQCLPHVVVAVLATLLNFGPVLTSFLYSHACAYLWITSSSEWKSLARGIAKVYHEADLYDDKYLDLYDDKYLVEVLDVAKVVK